MNRKTDLARITVESPLADSSETPPLTRRALRERREKKRPPTAGRAVHPVKSARSGASRYRVVRTALSGAVVIALTGSMALPAYAAFQSSDQNSVTREQTAITDAQSFVARAQESNESLGRTSYAATTPAEIAAKRAAALAAATTRAGGSRGSSSSLVDYRMVAPGSGTVRWPLGGPFRVGDGFGARGGAHMGTDMLAAGGTPVYASVAGTVRVSQDGYGAYGVAVTLDSVVNGQPVRTVYPHMRVGSRKVAVGQVVVAGQLLGLVGSTGRSTANHLHFEVYIRNKAIDSLAWLRANAN